MLTAWIRLSSSDGERGERDREHAPGDGEQLGDAQVVRVGRVGAELRR